MNWPDYSLEEAALRSGARFVAGVDEVGRGPLAGPVTAAAVILDAGCIPEGLNDSKKLTAKRREALAELVMARCDWAVGHASVEEIDRLNILRASHLAMCRAIAGLRQRPCLVLVDGNMLPRDLDLPGQAVVGGDARCLSIAAASILAKLLRDRIMVDLAQQHPGYGWEANAGYPTPAHRQALLDLGVTPYHRRSFAPVHKILCKEETATR
ncbi:ribonuclease HII [Paracoccus denitrificans]|jgi:ribonuclease HII|uniref:Ribonuclease HII n=1 Tax=Paracoccus denitrificans (strain Pd 1222) TaxID=318586 RepID=RNH2_PARDP|nr:ribonuclease HII [Paracoccus denitrificans]A1B3V0.1 RecName: Full=Ribonuclease HII; Short=RNase HII [Paracoccus denitrificans PD1222]ABL70194.1 RNase HII [Paracoccus denitrificans PD1222]MBB4629719.1 ribonuclease HII [Paracoccus denitrificans]MCU7430417.1 ribonuclease HII [Paracoccus denitrificans]QAR25550.1 ribonuclease HII [Paracoccus denitrificans]UFS65408.1 ribonuclease HII [Paracoccus denitrificans]